MARWFIRLSQSNYIDSETRWDANIVTPPRWQWFMERVVRSLHQKVLTGEENLTAAPLVRLPVVFMWSDRKSSFASPLTCWQIDTTLTSSQRHLLVWWVECTKPWVETFAVKVWWQFLIAEHNSWFVGCCIWIDLKCSLAALGSVHFVLRSMCATSVTRGGGGGFK